MAILKTATINEAQQALEEGSFVYNNPCCKCGKWCSTPTKDIWMRRIKEFGSIEQMYQQYTCRNCRKVEPLMTTTKEPMHNVAPEPAMNAAKKPLVQSEPSTIAPMKRSPKPGDAVKAPPGCIGVSIWETNLNGEMEYRGTQWSQVYKKEVEDK